MILLLTTMVFSTTLDCPDFQATKLKKESLDGVTLEKILFDGHTYIHLRNHWSNAGNAFLHDPGCICITKKEK